MATALRIAGRSSPLGRTSPLFLQRFNSTAVTVASPAAKPSHHNEHKRNHVYLDPNNFIGSWETPSDPKVAYARLAQIRRDYAKQVKELRKQYIYEVELQRQEQLRKDEARREQIRKEREERKKLKAAAAEARALERKAFEEQFRQNLLKEREEKREYWKMRQKKIADKMSDKKELLRRQSSMWIEEKDLEKKILEAIVDTTPL